MKRLVLILGDQLTTNISSLKDFCTKNDMILMCELHEEATYVKHHKKKIAFVFSAMRHFALALKKKNYNVKYIHFDDDHNTGSFRGEVQKAIQAHHIDAVIVTHPGEYRLLKEFKTWKRTLGIDVEIREDDRFLSSIEEFKQWAGSKKQLRMEYFYREIRKKYGILYRDNQPIGGQWNFDSDNRQPPKKGLDSPKPYHTKPDTITLEVLDLVNARFADHFGDLNPFHYAVTREDALEALNYFIKNNLKNFGQYQDAMIENNPWMFHSHISFYLNCGLLSPKECIDAAQEAYHKKHAPINSVEGFIRQVAGWREFVRGIYWLKMPGYGEMNFLQAKNPLPNFFWDANTDMNCLKQCISETKNHAYAHHIQRLMILGNYALLTGINPKEVQEWFLSVYADAYEWVEMPNVVGMILFADGGFLASKPYAAGGNYIKKMSNYCQNCAYRVNEKTGDTACPFNYLYWNFLDQHREKLGKNFRLQFLYKNLDKMDPNYLALIKKRSAEWIKHTQEDHI